jgi:gluconokinase
MIVIVIGVSGSGKTTISKLLAESLHYQFFDADDFHSNENIQKMYQGIPLNDLDRKPWLQSLQTAIKQWLQENKNVVLACSALKANYRQLLVVDKQVKLVYLKGSFEVIQKRLQQRQNHFMTEKLLQSQFDILEEPSNAITVDISQPVQEIVQTVQDALLVLN